MKVKITNLKNKIDLAIVTDVREAISDIKEKLTLKSNTATTYLKTETDVLLDTRQPLKSDNENYITNAQLAVLSCTSGANTGDETEDSIVSKLGLSTTNVSGLTELSGTNSGDETANSIETKLGITTANVSALTKLSGTNTGDETQSSILSKISTTGVASGTYTNASVTVDNYGRVTSASSGSDLSGFPQDKDIIPLNLSTTTLISTTSTTTTTTTTSTATLTMDATHTLAVTQACTIVLPKETTTKSRICRLKLTMSSIVTLTFQSSVKWCNNSSPSLTSTTATYVVTFITEDGGTSWEGSCSTFGA